MKTKMTSRHFSGEKPECSHKLLSEDALLISERYSYFEITTAGEFVAQMGAKILHGLFKGR